MKYILISLLFFSFIGSTKAQKKDSVAVVTAVEQLRTAMISGNQTELDAIASDYLSYGHSGGHVEGKKEFVDKIVSGKSDFLTIDLSEQTVTILNKTAIIRHTFNATTNDNGKPGAVKLKVMLVFQKEKGKWLMLARQAIKVV
jgi:hypothetical protein